MVRRLHPVLQGGWRKRSIVPSSYKDMFVSKMGHCYVGSLQHVAVEKDAIYPVM